MLWWNGNSNENMYERYALSESAFSFEGGMVERVKCKTLMWFGHVERMQNGKFAKMYGSQIVGPDVRGRPQVMWKSM